jgi:hypothetical protein
VSPLVPPLADHGDLVMALPFFGPVLLIGIGIAVMALRQRLQDRRNGT